MSDGAIAPKTGDQSCRIPRSIQAWGNDSWADHFLLSGQASDFLLERNLPPCAPRRRCACRGITVAPEAVTVWTSRSILPEGARANSSALGRSSAPYPYPGTAEAWRDSDLQCSGS